MKFIAAGAVSVAGVAVVCTCMKPGDLAEPDKGEYGRSEAIVSANVKGEGQAPSGFSGASVLAGTETGADEYSCGTLLLAGNGAGFITDG